MTSVRFGRTRSPFGSIWVAQTDAGIAACTRSISPDEMLDGLRRRFGDVELEPAEVDSSWLTGGGPARLDLRGLSTFDAAVYRAVVAIPAGETLTYGEVAARVGSPRAARAVGGAMGRCPLFPAVPCHRVVRASDGWSGWGGDVAFKRELLTAEGATSSALVLPRRPRRPSAPRHPTHGPAR